MHQYTLKDRYMPSRRRVSNLLSDEIEFSTTGGSNASLMENDVLWQVRAEKVNFIKQFQWFIEVLTPVSEIAGFPVGIINSNSPRSVASELVFAFF